MPEQKLAVIKPNAIVTLIGLAAVINAIRLFWNDSTAVLYESFDSGWIIKTGESILTSGIPFRDTFSWTAIGSPFVAYQWLFELACGLLYRQGGLWLVGLVSCVLSGVLYFYVLPRTWTANKVPIAIPYLMLALVLSPHWFNIRPQIFSYFLLLTFIHVLEKYRVGGQTKLLWTLPVLMLVWVNTHLFWSIGIALVACYCTLDFWRKLKSNTKTSSALLPVLAICAATTVVNPYGFHLIQYLGTFLNHSQFMGMDEVQPGITMQSAGFGLAYLALTWRTMIANRKTISSEGWIVVALATIAALMVRRYGSLAVILSWPYFGQALSRIDWKRYIPEQPVTYLQRQVSSVPRVAVSVMTLTAAVLVATCIWCQRCPSESYARYMYCGGSSELVTFAGKFLRPDDKLFNDPATGDWMLLLTKTPVFIDTRYDMYSKSLCDDAFACGWGAKGTLEYFDSWKASHIFVRNDFKPLAKLLNDSNKWTLIADDGQLSFWARKNSNTISRMSQAKLLDSELAGASISEPVMKLTRQHRAKKYFMMATGDVSTRPEVCVTLLQKAVDLLPTSQTLNDALAKARVKLAYYKNSEHRSSLSGQTSKIF